VGPEGAPDRVVAELRGEVPGHGGLDVGQRLGPALQDRRARGDWQAGHEPGFYCLTAPKVSPVTMWRWTISASTRTGSVIIVAAAASVPQLISS
jgi:hypothetical protein